MKLLLFRIKQDFETVCWKKQLLTLEKSTAAPRLSQSFQLLQRLLPKLSLPERQLPGEAQTMLPSICNSGILIRIRKSHPPQKNSSFPSAGKSLGRIKIKPSVQLFKSSDISSQPEIPTDHRIAAGISILKALLFRTQALRAKKEDAFLPQSKHVRALPHISQMLSGKKTTLNFPFQAVSGGIQKDKPFILIASGPKDHIVFPLFPPYLWVAHMKGHIPGIITIAH